MSTGKQITIGWLLILFLMSCVAQKTNDTPYYESLNEVRPRVSPPVDSNTSTTTTVVVQENKPVTFKKTVNQKIDVVLDSIDRFNLTRRSVDGYTIQIYSGQNREEAMNTKKKISTDIPDLTANLQYQQPKFRVTVGKYFSKLEAYQDLTKLRESFPSAILVPEKIAIR
jgi:SPOR domain